VRSRFDDRPAGSPPDSEPVTVWTRIRGRYPEWKAHTSLRAARAAVTYAHGDGRRHLVELWTWDGSAWHLEPPKA
jgi:hypothetical protein